MVLRLSLFSVFDVVGLMASVFCACRIRWHGFSLSTYSLCIIALWPHNSYLLMAQHMKIGSCSLVAVLWVAAATSVGLRCGCLQVPSTRSGSTAVRSLVLSRSPLLLRCMFVGCFYRRCLLGTKYTAWWIYKVMFSSFSCFCVFLAALFDAPVWYGMKGLPAQRLSSFYRNYTKFVLEPNSRVLKYWFFHNDFCAITRMWSAKTQQYLY